MKFLSCTIVCLLLTGTAWLSHRLDLKVKAVTAAMQMRSLSRMLAMDKDQDGQLAEGRK